MRVGLLTEGGYPYASGEARLWCDRLVRGLAQHEFEVYSLSRSARQAAEGFMELPGAVRRVRTAPLWGEGARAPRRVRGTYGRRERRRFAECFGEMAAAISAPGGPGSPGTPAVAGASAAAGAAGCQADRFASGLYGLAELARERGGLPAALRSETAVRALERACHTPGTLQGAHQARVADLLTVTGALERALRPLSLDWYGDGEGSAGEPGLSGVDLCHAASAGPAALPGLLARRFFGTPLLVTEYGVRLREYYLASAAAPGGAVPPGPVFSGPVRALLASFHGRLTAEAYARAALITPGNTHARRWQERCGAAPERLRTVYPGMDASRFAEVGERGAGSGVGARGDDGWTLVWLGRLEPAKDIVALLHAFAQVRRAVPRARLRLVETGRPARAAGGYPAHCRALAAHLFPDEAADAHTVGDNPVSFEHLGDPGLPSAADAYAAGSVVALSSVVEGFPVGLVEAMFCGRATVSTDVGAVCEVIGGTGLVVPPRNPRALGDACLELLADPERRERLGAAARARALELFTAEQNVAAFRGIYLELMSHCPVRREELGPDGEPVPFARPAEAHIPGRWAGGGGPGLSPAAHTPTWATAQPGPEPEPLGVGPYAPLPEEARP
ncbi:DUF3492 domain-containing protein [Streptomyces sp. ME19-01-6]|uniref:DUF3492 domain-containing protein n=1 Tax=Streptomyces sp. ME19-01-6 TaxID=3028686 RepID=UPI0029A31B80|nr:DUF3492 domain-containing protein [Streptomyces sp. ME19-01-6]MDX3225741.1 DUF3492 domain-containing protein [Streptomyces sp. ME19-01-6]